MEKPIVVAEYQNRMQAEISQNLLQSFGVECRIWADDLGGIRPEQSFVRRVKLLVNAGDAEKAKDILRKQDTEAYE